MKKILVVHNKYRKEGEDIAVDNEINILKRNYEVDVLYFENYFKNPFIQFIYFILTRTLIVCAYSNQNSII